MTRLRTTAIAAAVLALAARAAAAESLDARARLQAQRAELAEMQSIEEQAFGPLTYTAYTVGAADFVPSSSSAGFAINANLQLVSQSGSNVFYAPVHLESGVRIEHVELAACDNHATQEVIFSLLRANDTNGAPETIAIGSTLGTPGCTFWGPTLLTNATIDNLNQSYVVKISLGDEAAAPYSPLLALRSLRIYWSRQMAPADENANFTDVPLEDSTRQAIEAATGAGILGPCAGSNFCPQNPVTRAQLATALAKALGLGWSD